MSCSGVATGDVSEESCQEKLQLPQRWWQALVGGGRMEQRETYLPHLLLSCFPETERNWVPSEQHPHTHCRFREGSLFCLFYATWGRQSNRKLERIWNGWSPSPTSHWSWGQQEAKDTADRVMPFYNASYFRRRPRPEYCKFKSWLNYRMCSNLPAWTTVGETALE